MDLEVAFSDSLSGVDPDSVGVVANRPVKGPVGSNGNLLEFWRIIRADSTGIVVEETTGNLLPRGEVLLTIRVADRVGNRVSRTIRLDLPPAARYKVIDLGAVFKVNSSQVTIGPDSEKAYVTTEEFGGSALSIVDLETLELLKVVRTPIDALSETVVDEARGLLYLVSIDEPFVAVFDLATEAFQAPIATSDRGIGVTLSRQRDRLYVGLETISETSGAFISVVDLATRTEEQVFDLGVASEPRPDQPVQMAELVLDPTESRVLATTLPDAQAGILIFDPNSGAS